MGFLKETNTGKGIGRQPKTCGVSFTLLPWVSLLLYSVKYDREKWFSINRPKSWAGSL